ncbi:hydrolase or acyltransferase, alpha/beta fold family [Geotalea daltonii FRC-32]|uniref:Hydrolase or acyltransferase, alpha/beta fold family n=1 Tax=Geotalea daltonii (strain DSM 22248 / JCM 15807 / FRC-32) TaxID=316067 RepID=B9M4S0_GEODF|nr:alpha/beta hydrolase [Geotalea daltonii]ACM21604.1 hydrolase or acyltransferase, alpha/beta fold family [Geotalea daltonii FRC-32]
MTKILLLVLLIALTVLCQGCVGRLFYYPDKETYDTPARHGLPFEEVTFASKDGTRLSGWFIPAVGKPKGTVIHFHGNAQNMTAHFGFVSWLPAEGFNLFVFDYRGYGKSAGRPNRQGVFEDSVAAISYIAARKDVDQNRLLILGQSLGGTNAIAAVGMNRFTGIRAVAIESTFASYREIVRDKIGEIPIVSLFKWPLSYLLVGNSHSADQVVDKIAPLPLLLIYGDEDPIIPYRHGKKLFEKAKEPKQFWTIKGGSHTEAFLEAGSPYRAKLVSFFLESLDGKLKIPK